ncbi:hypothetical protein EV426DRAFT_699703 [Tirmania nivea]|nr:hypothetical protein EV426DRAFT_699703 [Tirmania nivea]
MPKPSTHASTTAKVTKRPMYSGSLKIPPTLLRRLRQQCSKDIFDLIQGIAAGVPEAYTLVTLTDLTSVADICRRFKLAQAETTAPDFLADVALIPAARSTTFDWPVPLEDMEDWVARDLSHYGIDLAEELHLALQPDSPLLRLLYNYRLLTTRDTEAACRTPVDLILLEALAVISGTNKRFRQERDREKQTNRNHHHHEQTPSKFRNVQLKYEIPLHYDRVMERVHYSGRVDWTIATTTESTGSRNTQYQATRSLLAVVECKQEITFEGAYAQILAYMAVLYRHREEVGARQDFTTYGIATDGYRWKFCAITPHSGTSTTMDTTAVVRETAEFRLVRGDIRPILLHVLYVIIQGYSCLTPASTPEKPVKGHGNGSGNGNGDGDVAFLAADDAEVLDWDHARELAAQAELITSIDGLGECTVEGDDYPLVDGVAEVVDDNKGVVDDDDVQATKM